MQRVRSFGTGQATQSPDLSGFAVPFGGGVWQDRRDSTVGYNSSTYGMLAGLEKRSSTRPAWVFGGSAAVSGQSVNTKLPYDGSGRSTAFNLGLHARYAPSDSAGPYPFGQAQVGVEDGKLDRSINVAAYSANHTSKWTGWNGSLAASGSYRWALSDTVSAGSITSLSYTRLSRPGLTEAGSNVNRLKLDSAHFNSLRSSLGVTTGIDLPLADKRAL